MSLESRRAHFLAPNRRGRVPSGCGHLVEQGHAQIGVVHGIPHHVEGVHLPTGQPVHAQFPGRQQAIVQTVHEPGQNPADGDGVEAQAVGMVVEFFCGPLVEDAAQGSHGLVRFVVFLEGAVHFLADGGAGFAAGVLLFGLDGLFVELLEVMIPDEPFVQVPPFFPTPVDGAVVEGQDIAVHGGVIDAEGSARVELRVVPVFGGGLQVLGRHPQVEFVLEPLVGHGAVTEILIDVGSAVDDSQKAVFLKQLAAEPAPAGPGIHMRGQTLFQRSGHDGADIRIARGRSDGQDPGVFFIPRPEQTEGMLHHGIHAFGFLVPDPLGRDRNQFHLDFFAVVPVQIQERRIRGLADETEHVEAEVVEHQGRAAHGGDIKTMPTGGNAGEDEPVGAGENRAGQQSGADGQGVVFEGQMNPEVHGAEKSPMR